MGGVWEPPTSGASLRARRRAPSCVSWSFSFLGAWGNVSGGAPKPPGRGERGGRAPDPGGRVSVEHWFYQQSPSSTFLHSYLQHSIFWADFSRLNFFGHISADWIFWADFSSLIFSGNFQQSDIFRQFSAGWFFWADFSSLIFSDSFQQADIFRQFSAGWYFQTVFSKLTFLSSFQQSNIFRQERENLSFSEKALNW